MIQAMATTHITEAEAACDLAGILARLRAGKEIVIESGAAPGVVMRSMPAFEMRTLSESLAIATAPAKELGYSPVMDAEFAADMEEMIRNRKPLDHSAWDWFLTRAY